MSASGAYPHRVFRSKKPARAARWRRWWKHPEERAAFFREIDA